MEKRFDGVARRRRRAADARYEEALEANGLPQVGQIEQKSRATAQILAIARSAIRSGAGSQTSRTGLRIRIQTVGTRFVDGRFGFGCCGCCCGAGGGSGRRCGGRLAEDDASILEFDYRKNIADLLDALNDGSQSVHRLLAQSQLAQ